MNLFQNIPSHKIPPSHPLLYQLQDTFMHSIKLESLIIILNFQIFTQNIPNLSNVIEQS